LPALPRNVDRRWVVAATGPSARSTAERFKFESCGTSHEAAFADPSVDLVIIATRHDSHAALAAEALRAGKAVWLEKPAALNEEQLATLEAAARETGGFLTMGYNRRFSSHARAIRAHFSGRQGPLSIHYTVSAGPPPRGTWITDPKIGGGRVIGEMCHFVDLCTYLVGAPPASVFARSLGRDPERDDSTVALLSYADGSVATIEYLANADTSLPKERFEASASGLTARCENFRATELLLGRGKGRSHRSAAQEKGQDAALREVLEAMRRGAPSPFAPEEIIGVSEATFGIEQSAWSGIQISLPRSS
jgi:predicted dehydrogenase